MPRSSTPADRTTLATVGRAILPSAQKTASAPRTVSFRGSITRPAHALCTLRSWGHPRTTQHSVPAGAYPLPGQDFHLLGSSRKFPSCRACYMASPSSRLRLAQFPRKLSFPWRCHPRLKRTAAASRRVFLTACVPPSARATKPPHGRTSAGSVRTAKGGHQRVTMLPGSVRAALGGHLRAVKTQHDADLRIGTGSVALPGALATKPSSISNWNSKAPQSWS